MTSTLLMRAVRCHKFAALAISNSNATTSKAAATATILKPPEPIRSVLSLDHVPVPKLDGVDDVLIKTHYAGVQYPDFLQAQGLYQVRPPLPYIPGMDITGTIIQTGSNVSSSSNLNVGDKVLATLTSHGGSGGLSEQCTAPSHSIYKIPHNIPLTQVANLGRNYFAAYHSLKNIANISKDSLVLVDGASGGVGMAAIELAKAMGARVIAGVSHEDKMRYPKSIGADYVFCYGRNDMEKYKEFKNDVKDTACEMGHDAGVDVIIDVVQGDLFEKALLSCVRPLGTICLIGFTGGQKSIRPGLVLIKEVNVVGSLWGRWARENPGKHGNNVTDILEYMACGVITPRANRLFDMEEYWKAFEVFEGDRGQGNCVVQVCEE